MNVVVMSTSFARLLMQFFILVAEQNQLSTTSEKNQVLKTCKQRFRNYQKELRFQ